MKTYLEAYRERLEKNQADLIELAKAVLLIDKEVKVYKHYDDNLLIDGLVFIKNESINSIHFHEVPYRWSGCGYTQHGKSHHGTNESLMPFSPEDVLNSFGSITSVRLRQPNENFKTVEQYLKWYSYLKEYNPFN